MGFCRRRQLRCRSRVTEMDTTTQLNPSARAWRYQPLNPQSETTLSPVLSFHRALPTYNQTTLHSLPDLAAELELGHVLVKDESNRFGLPSFKVLGASWAVYRAVGGRLGLDVFNWEVLIATLGEVARNMAVPVTVVTCTEGNWGRAVAWMGRQMGVDVVVYVPEHMVEETRELIRKEGVKVVVAPGDYDDAAEAAMRWAKSEVALAVFDMSWEGYEEIPNWVVEGYQTMLDESDVQVPEATGGKTATHAIVPCGCGSVARAVTQHYKSKVREATGAPAATVIAVETSSAACLTASLEKGEMTRVGTGSTIMCGMNCGTLSSTAWPILKEGVDASVIVSEMEAHGAVLELHQKGVEAGPCGAATLAALRKVCKGYRAELGLTRESVVVLHCTEGMREYIPPT
ncbi:tryptophan synthase beta subunit-like PLP-dependent enzyme [Echria macrotheca]|uniref:Tryptophan synthase beta subunit-like PLP-dependent enzyme n=1 Tax=Echria macrotheca TaxID=438768 RepID=A0AAJ0BIH2_9PEZI|nr:tryptophan synthase beta subunit-like PLP-dependent enzyme [Echria macrotheca]